MDEEPPPSELPFANISGNAEDAWFGAGIAETLAASLQGAGVTILRCQERQEPDRKACGPSAACAGSDSGDPGGGQATSSRHVRGLGSVGALVKFGDCRCAQWEAGVLHSRGDPLASRVLKGVRLALGNIDLDRCSSQKEVLATAWYGAGEDGLTRPWEGGAMRFPRWAASCRSP